MKAYSEMITRKFFLAWKDVKLEIKKNEILKMKCIHLWRKNICKKYFNIFLNQKKWIIELRIREREKIEDANLLFKYAI